MHDPAIGADQRQFAKSRFMLHEACFQPAQHSGARTAGPQRLLAGTCGQQGIDVAVIDQPLQGANGRKDHQEPVLRMACQRICRAHPGRLELLAFVGHRRLAFGHARHQKGHVETPGQVAVGDPVRQREHGIGGEREPKLSALWRKRCVAVHRDDIGLADGPAIAMARQQHAQFLEALADGRDGLRQLQIALGRAPRRDGVRGTVGSVDAAARKHIGPRRKTRGGGAPCHQHFDAVGAVAHQQHRGGCTQGRGFARRVELLVLAWHD